MGWYFFPLWCCLLPVPVKLACLSLSCSACHPLLVLTSVCYSFTVSSLFFPPWPHNAGQAVMCCFCSLWFLPTSFWLLLWFLGGSMFLYAPFLAALCLPLPSLPFAGLFALPASLCSSACLSLAGWLSSWSYVSVFCHDSLGCGRLLRLPAWPLLVLLDLVVLVSWIIHSVRD